MTWLNHPDPDGDFDPDPALTLPLTSAHRGWLRAGHGHAAAPLEMSVRANAALGTKTRVTAHAIKRIALEYLNKYN